MFNRIWQWLIGSHVHSAINDFENAKAKLFSAVEKEKEILTKHLNVKDKAIALTTTIQQSIKDDFDRLIAKEVERFDSALSKIEGKIDNRQTNISRGQDIIEKIKAAE